MPIYRTTQRLRHVCGRVLQCQYGYWVGVCREARGGACVGYAEEVTGQRKSLKAIDRQTSGTCPEANSGASQTGQCKNGKCDVWIGGGDFCSQCSQTTDYLINGKCTADNTESACEGGQPSAGVCTSCKSGYFLHRGGCYQIGTEPGNLVCKDTTASSTQGTCDECQAGYFRNPASASDATRQSCIACNDTTGADSNLGVASCAECTAPAASGSSGSSQKAKCTACADGYFVDSDGAACTQCQDTDNCAKCDAGADKCTKCKMSGTKPYFKKNDGDDPTGTCVTREECKTTHFPKDISDSDKKCLPCGDATNGGIANCQACTMSGSAVTCDTCTEGNKPNTAKTACVPCSIEGCTSCDKGNVCAACDSSHYLTPTAQCVDSCDKLGGYYADGNVCKPCSPKCASCTAAGANKCLSCPAGKALKYTSESSSTDGTCVDECKTNTGGCTDCGAAIGGSRYCSRCSTSSEYPVNGVCKASTARANECKTPDNKGGCSVCASGYFLLDNGCYKTDRQPGSQVCKTEGSGKCTKCANEQTPDQQGSCPACPAGCSKCSDANTCTECLAGYYKTSANTCVKCDTDDNTIKGVPNCVSCKEPSGGSGTVTCYVTQTPAVNPTDPSTNKGGLSSGAIAGISVAVIVVVGGLVGFLCWWFVCRGKA
ncbi:Variant-specific surface protein [Giardia duodenalis]|uniref:Variant-specific surface protein n=1 Tax=Giardia intestinalis TaxID=5741 RepID=V6TU81_GIAIN|nr:Variant-specific surface protein [Giardia intestinalis]